ncbi:MAG: hypothetical protein RJA33_1309 [Actinomycetota bacterium]|jgi:hypothetical protein
MKKTLIAGASALALIASLLVSIVPSANAALNVPKSVWPVCSQSRTVYCVESVSVTTLAGNTIALSWVADGATLNPVDSSTVTTDSSTVTSDTTTASTPIVTIPTLATGRAVAGRWTSANWSSEGLDLLGYGGLYVEAKTANEFVNHIFMNVLPTIASSTNKINIATQPANTNYPANLDSDISIAVTVKTGEVKPGVVVGVGTNFTGDYSSANGQSTIRFSGSPVNVPLAAQSSDCSGETGVARAMVRQLQAVLFINNEGQSAFGVDGVTGDMVVSSNGVCDLSTPVWNADLKEFTFTAAAPHFAPDGTTLNYGFYKAIIPAADAKLLWGLENANDAVKALNVQIISTVNEGNNLVSTVGVRNGKIIIDISGFHYSRPKLKISLKKDWKPAKTMLNKTTITCTMGKTVKKITAVKPTCPKGYKKR